MQKVLTGLKPDVIALSQSAWDGTGVGFMGNTYMIRLWSVDSKGVKDDIQRVIITKQEPVISKHSIAKQISRAEFQSACDVSVFRTHVDKWAAGEGAPADAFREAVEEFLPGLSAWKFRYTWFEILFQ